MVGQRRTQSINSEHVGARRLTGFGIHNWAAREAQKAKEKTTKAQVSDGRDVKRQVASPGVSSSLLLIGKLTLLTSLHFRGR
jgi:hypothetical protein